MDHNEIVTACPALFVTPKRNAVIWCSGAYKEPSPFPGPVVWVSVIFANRQREVAERIALLTLN